MLCSQGTVQIGYQKEKVVSYWKVRDDLPTKKKTNECEENKVHKSAHSPLSSARSMAAFILALRAVKSIPNSSSNCLRTSLFVTELRSAPRKRFCTAFSISASEGVPAGWVLK